MKKMHSFATLAFGMAIGIAWAGSARAAERWKGTPSPAVGDVSAMTGLAIVNGEAAFAVLGAAAGKILNEGFVDDINDQVFAEMQLGGAFANGGSALLYSVHLRWDFQMDDKWRFFSLGGLGGSNSGVELGDRFTVHPRFGVGAFYTLSERIVLRLDVSHEASTVGVNFAF